MLPDPVQSEIAPLPEYLVKTYTWAYLRPASLKLLDRELIVNGILWGNYRRLVRAACNEFASGNRVLQAASVYGNLSSRLAAQVGQDGFLDVIDVSSLQVEHCRRKLAGRGNVRVRVADAANPGETGYDGACCFFLLHEVPDAKKRQIIDALVASVRVGGKVVVVDYHLPAWWSPLKPVMSTVFRWLEPFASSLWTCQIGDLASAPATFDVEKRTHFGGLYQKVVLARRH